MSDAEQSVDQILRHGTRNTRRIAEAARVLPELVRRLNVATLDVTLTDPGDINTIVQAVHTATTRLLPQLLLQLAVDLRLLDADRLRSSASGMNAVTSAGDAAEHLRLAADRLNGLAPVLDLVVQHTDRLYLDDGTEGD